MFNASARSGGIFMTVGDLLACGKERLSKFPPEVAVQFKTEAGAVI